MTAGSSMAAMILNSPPHCGQCSRSRSNTRLRRRAQLIRAGAPCACSSAGTPGFADVRGAVAPGALELEKDLAFAIAAESFVGDRGARDVAAQAFEFLALMRPAAHPGMLTPARI